ncbi:bifunctional demethylmenaquinone methyltransferase/2-methoxy-6-polyprenyl-1,4-benzoquinol methylase UbiE [bacterium endosymbiont of Pedicinus badii]|uniref:bifunctional demethylmenaquinone methyltransferase/2-methoxy-6-polyprenyl-1,4-benzoquinol methylase UbiE n=1 Tax=bacterium endosymbiont of Pedicinus badii TaxID=1719126 RepID=UPI0009BBBBBF|nr:bifunctional demethylmenaquinone methyltransferase/2-methoxy-6-polyprenyl-1,4-benzoquinol methylase UbiE [bacterium endosymbiont of Pedicinus badii]OQM34083.1 hypothetical protein AOQ89_01875 [bacterium endosymbiont of Pedicinus badii]
MFKSKKRKLVHLVFKKILKKYDLMNDIMSFGLHRLWKNNFIKSINIKSGQIVLDLACGTADISEKIIKLFGTSIKLILVDSNYDMIQLGREKIRNAGNIKNIYYLQSEAENLPFLQNSFDHVIISFGIRNFFDKSKSLKSIHKILKKKGKLSILEFSMPNNKTFKKIYNFYSFKVIPILGKIVSGQKFAYKYLVNSIRHFPKRNKFKNMLIKKGFKKVKFQKKFFGIITIYQGEK